MHRQQFDGCHAQRGEVLEDRWVGEPCVRPALVLGDGGMQSGDSLDVRLVDDGVAPCGTRGLIVAPIEVVVDHDAARYVRCGVQSASCQVVIAHVTEDGRPECEAAFDGLRVRIYEQLVRVPSMAVGGIPRSVHTEAVARAGGHMGHVVMEDVEDLLLEWNAGLVPVLVEDAQVDRGGSLRPDRDVGATVLVGRDT